MRSRSGDEPVEAPQSRRLTPSIGLAPDSETPSDASNEDFLFHLYRGSELLQDNRMHEAKEELERALKMQPRDAKGQDLLAVVYFRLGHYARAITIYEQLLKKSPRDPALLLNAALCYLKTGQPALAKRELTKVLEINPSHQRAWGYLGLACERLGEIDQAQRAFEQGGHGQMARRMAARKASMKPPASVEEESQPTREVREVVATAFEELDAGELSFEIAKPASDKGADEADGSWRSIELGQPRRETEKPDTKDGPPPAQTATVGATAAAQSTGHRPTLIAPIAVPPPAQEPTPIAGLDHTPSPRPPLYALDDAASAPARTAGAISARGPAEPRKKTLPPPVPLAPPPVEQLARDSFLAFPEVGRVAVHPTGVALVKTSAEAGFSVRIEAITAHSSGLSMKLLERQTKGKSTGESFGGVASPIVLATGDGQMLIAPRAGRKLSSFFLDDEMCFAREEVLLGFDGRLGYENGKLATGEGEFVSVVQLRGTGAVLLEAIGEILTLEVQTSRAMSVRREVILGWFGRLVPRALAPSETPAGQRGLVSFAGEGQILVASA